MWAKHVLSNTSTFSPPDVSADKMFGTEMQRSSALASSPLVIHSHTYKLLANAWNSQHRVCQQHEPDHDLTCLFSLACSCSVTRAVWTSPWHPGLRVTVSVAGQEHPKMFMWSCSTDIQTKIVDNASQWIPTERKAERWGRDKTQWSCTLKCVLNSQDT